MAEMDSVWGTHCDAWRRRLRHAEKSKQEDFGKWADTCMAFYVGSLSDEEFWNKHMRSSDIPDEAGHDMKFCMAKAAELVQLYGPAMYHNNPQRQVTMRELPTMPFEMMVPPELLAQSERMQRMQQQNPQLQQDQQFMMQGQMIQQQIQQYREQFEQKMFDVRQKNMQRQLKKQLFDVLLNYTPNENNLKEHSRKAIDEALIKGMGCLWVEADEDVNGSLSIGSFYDSVDNLVIDPDAECWEDVKWIARRCCHWVNDVAEEYGVDINVLKEHGTFESYGKEASTAANRANGAWDTSEDIAKDMLVYWKIWSKQGMGQFNKHVDKKTRKMLRSFGKNVYLVVAEGIDYPLNMPSDKVSKAKSKDGMELRDDLFMRAQWPIPLWIDNEWPVSCLKFHDIPNCPWPMSHLRPALPELKFMNWMLSFMATRSRQTSRLIVGLAESGEEENKSALESGAAVTVLKFTQNQEPSKMMQILNMPQGGATELLAVSDRVEQQFEKRTGLTELAYASHGGMRSAEEARIKGAALNVRPDDMANKVEDWMTEVARKEAKAAAWLMQGTDVIHILGDDGAAMWDQLIVNDDPTVIAKELDFRIEAGSVRKPNRAGQIEEVNAALQVMGPTLTQLAMNGNVGPWNALMKRFAKVNDIEDVDELLLPPPPPPQPPQPDPSIQAKANAEVQKMQLMQQKLQMEMQMKAQDLQIKTQLSQVKAQEMQNRMALDAAKAQQEMKQDNMKFMQEMSQRVQRAQVDAATQPSAATMA